MDQRDDSIKQFCAITATTAEQARFFLESSGWEVEVALQNFYEGDGRGGEYFEDVNDADEDETPHGAASPAGPSPVPASARAGPVQGVGLFPSQASQAADRPKDKKSASSSRGSVRTLSDLNRHSESDSDDDKQEYYTGGEKSGMMVQDPQKVNRVDAIFEQARRMGAQQAPSEPAQARPNNQSIFSGTGRTLAGESARQPGEEAGRAGRRTTSPQQTLDPVIRNITFWRNGFTVDDGPLRRLDDPANAEFLRSIGKSECPKELEPEDRRTPVHVNLMRREEDFMPPPEPRHVPFQGLGRTLGSDSSTEVASVPVSRGISNQASQGLIVDDTKPMTSIQLRLSDGTRMVARFNHYHTVADIRQFIDAARPGSASSYQLQTMGFPPKILGDLSQTIEAAGLANAVVIQKA